MKIINITRQTTSNKNNQTSFIFSPDNLKEIWLFNCNEGCQHQLRQYKIKVSQISKIIITNLHINNISGILGLLSSLSSNSKIQTIHIYSPKGLDRYIKLGKKYSRTNFKYNLYFHILQTGLTINQLLYQKYTYIVQKKFEFSIVSKEQLGKFKLANAKYFNLKAGPLYGKLKQEHDIITPDGLILNNKNFTYKNKPGKKTSFIFNTYIRRNSTEVSNKVNM